MSETFELPLVPEDEVVVRVIEAGVRPRVMTRARAASLLAAEKLGEFMGQRRFAQLALVVIDWSNELQRQPDEVAKPVMFLQLQRFFPDRGDQGAYLNVEGRIDIDDVFRDGAVTRALLEDLINELGTCLSDKFKEGNR
jgi:hypothetical protein